MFADDGEGDDGEGLSMFNEDKNVEFLSYDGYEIKYDEDLLVFRFSFCDAVRMAPELKIDLSHYRQLVAELAALPTESASHRIVVDSYFSII
jgi:hypothetical protein